MALFLTATLGISIVGMVALLVAKRYELNTGRIFLAHKRPAIGEFFHRKMQWVEYALPGLVRVGVRRTYLFVRSVLRVWAIKLLSRVEQRLERILAKVRSSAPPRRGGQSSAFLREVVEHKKEVRDNLPDKIVIED